MARLFDGNYYAYNPPAGALPLTDEFTIALWVQPANLTQSACGVLQATLIDNSVHWTLTWEEAANNQIGFTSVGYTGSDPATDSGITLDAADVLNGCWIAYRKTAAGEWSKWKNGSKTVIDASITFAIPDISGALSAVIIGAVLDGPSLLPFNGSLAEVAMWSVALSDEQMAEAASGVAADVVRKAGLAAYFPLRGNTDPEPNYMNAALPAIRGGAPAAAPHPTIVPPWFTDTAEPAWVVDILHPDGTIRAATTDLDRVEDFDVLGAFYPQRIADDIRLLDALPDGGAGVMVPANTVVTLSNADDALSVTDEWRQVPVKIRYYDRVTHALETKFSGVIADASFPHKRAVFTCSSMDAADLETLVPRQTIEPAADTGIIDDIDGDEIRHDVGAPIPVPMGSAAYMTPPYIGNTGTAEAGQNFLVGFGTAFTVDRAWTDTDPHSPGLELLTLWADGPGTPTYASASAFTVGTSVVDLYYRTAMPVRRIHAGGTVISDIASVSGGTVTLTHAILGTPLGTIQVAGDYGVERARFSYVGTGGTTALTTMRLYASTNAPVVTRVSTTGNLYGNPAAAIAGILSDPDWGVGGSVDAVSFFTAGVAFEAAGLGSAVSGVLGGDKSQRRALDVANELAAFRGMTIWKDADTSAWKARVDSAPGTAAITLSFGPDVGGTPSPNNVRAVRSIYSTPLSNAVSTLKLKYGASWRERGNRSIEEAQYEYHNTTTVLGVGRERVIVNPWLRSHVAAARVAYYTAKRMASEDRLVVVEMRHEARRIRLGDVVPLDLQVTPTTRITGPYRVIQIERTLTEFALTCAGPFDAGIYATDLGVISAAVNQPAGDTNPDERGTNPGSDANLILNSDFTTGLTRVLPGHLIDSDTLPDWNIIASGALASMSVVPSRHTRGGAYLELVRNELDWLVSLYTGDSSTPEPLDGSLPVIGGITYLLSIYADTPEGWRFRCSWWGGTATLLDVTPTIRINPGDVNPSGWPRYYSVLTAPGSATVAAVGIELPTPSVTVRFDAVQFEEVTRITVRPSPWKRSARYGIQPAQITPGDLRVRAEGVKELATKIGAKGTAVVALSGGTVTVGTADAGLITGFSGRIKSPVTGCATWRLAFNRGGGTVTTILRGLGTATGTFTTDAVFDAITFPIHLGTATPIVAIPQSGGTAFTGGSVVVSTHRITHTAVEA